MVNRVINQVFFFKRLKPPFSQGQRRPTAAIAFISPQSFSRVFQTLETFLSA
jgi:hypothetical protein